MICLHSYEPHPAIVRVRHALLQRQLLAKGLEEGTSAYMRAWFRKWPRRQRGSQWDHLIPPADLAAAMKEIEKSERKREQVRKHLAAREQDIQRNQERRSRVHLHQDGRRPVLNHRGR